MCKELFVIVEVKMHAYRLGVGMCQVYVKLLIVKICICTYAPFLACYSKD